MTSKQIFLVAFFQVAMLTTFAQKLACKSLHIGSFKVFTKESGTTYIKRTPTQQFETNDDLGYKIIFSIKWIDQCTYELRPQKLLKGNPLIMGNGKDYVRTRIKDITSTGYTAETSSSFSEAIVDFTVEIVR